MNDTKNTNTNTNKKQNKNKNNVNIKRYYVIRDGHRVSENEYETKEDASNEYGYWKSLTLNWDPTSKVSIFDKQGVKS